MLMIISCKTFFKSMLISEYPKPNMDLTCFGKFYSVKTKIFVELTLIVKLQCSEITNLAAQILVRYIIIMV